MITANNISLAFGERILFKDVTLKFLPGNCYGMIGANGAGKSTFMRILAGEIEPTTGTVDISKGQRLAMLEQDQFKYDDSTVLETVFMGHQRLYRLMQERDALYQKADFSEEDGLRSADLETEFAELGGYEAEAEAARMLDALGIDHSDHYRLMGDLDGSVKVRVLLAQALFGNPDILLMDEPTNQLDLQSIQWLETFLANFDNTVIVISHDRHFINNVCTHITDVDFGQIRLYAGNYDFWYRASQLAAEQRKNTKKKNEDRIRELQEFVLRFGANVAKARQATSRKKLIDKLTLEDLPSTSRKFPYIDFRPDRPTGRVVLRLEGISKRVDGEQLLNNLTLQVEPGDKIAFVGSHDVVKTTLFEIIMGEMEPDSGTIHWGQTITPGYFPKENSAWFQSDLNLVEWLRQYTTSDDETYIRGFLGRMLFSGEEALKPAHVLSGGEKVRCMLSRMMLSGANVLVLDEPTNHLDLEAITALNDGLERFSEVALLATHDFQLIDTVANRIVEIAPGGVIDRRMPFRDYVKDPAVQALRTALYAGSADFVF
jgi:ATPase subunit of ABC transporter with duplicated ATPase domains